MTNVMVRFFDKIGHDVKLVFQDAFSLTFEQKVLSTIAYTEPFVNGIVSLADPQILPVVEKVEAAVVGDLTTLKNLAQAGKVAPGSTAAQQVVAALGSIKSNLSALLADTGVKNSSKVTQITAAVNLINGEVDAILESAPPASA